MLPTIVLCFLGWQQTGPYTAAQSTLDVKSLPRLKKMPKLMEANVVMYNSTQRYFIDLGITYH